MSNLATTPSFDFDLKLGAEINKDDLLAISISSYEQTHEAIVEASRAEVKELEAIQTKQKEALAKIVKSAVDKHAKDKEKSSAQIAKLLGIAVTFNVSDIQTTKDEVNYSTSSSLDIKVSPGSGCNSFGFRLFTKFPITPEIVKARNEFEATGRVINEAGDRGAAARLALTKLPSVERKAKAQLAIIGLQDTERGQKLLTKLQKSLG